MLTKKDFESNAIQENCHTGRKSLKTNTLMIKNIT